MKAAASERNSNRFELSGVPVRTCIAAIAAVTWFALALQFYLMMIAAPAARVRLAANFFSFFTIQTNLLIALGLTLLLVTPDSQWGRFVSRPVVASGTAVYIAVVGMTYSLLLRSCGTLREPTRSPMLLSMTWCWRCT